MLSRRQLLASTAGFAGYSAFGPAAAAEALKLEPALPDGLKAGAVLDALPGKKPLLKLSFRPPNYETPLNYFDSVFTPNDAFFVRYHLSDIPEIDAAKWKLTIQGGATPVSVSLDDLKKMPAVEIAAVCQCSGNRRGLFQPHVPGVQWGYGAMGNARWKGVRLKDLLEKAGVRKEAVELVINGADGPVIDKTPDFVKSLPMSKALDENVLIAYEMNGAPLPHWNGFPARLVVPGWTATYWMKHITELTMVDKPFEGFWMKGAYRVPLGKFPAVDRFVSQETAVNTPITEMVVNSIISSPAEGDKATAGKPLAVKGLAWDGGYGIVGVEVSTDGGESWARAKLGEDTGRFSFRAFLFEIAAAKAGPLAIMVRAINKIGQTQTSTLNLNPAGYHHNVMHRVTVAVA